MIVKRLSLTGWRNYEFENAEFSPAINVITGKNAQGKTNLLEAVYMLSSGKSFRTRFDRETVGFEYDSAEILAEAESQGRDHTIRMIIKPGQPKKITVNGVRKTASELSETLNVVLFCPDDLYIIKEGASNRRRLIDNAIGQIRPKYSELLSDFNRYYDNKTRILKDWHDKPSLLDALDDFSEGMCRTGAQIIRYRAAFIKRLNETAAVIHSDFSGSGEKLKLEYATVGTVTDPFAAAKDIYYELCEHQESHRQAEIESGQCLSGIHRDDMEISINGMSAKSFASQGQTRTAALSLKLAEREIFLNETGEYPVLLLDDVLSELDEKRQSFVLNRIGGGQTFITCCEDSDISGRTGGKVLTINNGRII